MVGKASLLLVLGFSVIFLVFGERFGSLSNQAVDNMTGYYAQTVAHDCAVAGANMAANKVFLDNNWSGGFYNRPFNGGIINVTVKHTSQYGDSVIQITSIGTCDDTTHKSVVILRPSKFSKFAYYSVKEIGPDGSIIYWTGNDTVWGPFHSQDFIHVSKHPVFNGKVTTAQSDLIYLHNKSSDYPEFNAGYDPNINMPIPFKSMDNLKSTAI